MARIDTQPKREGHPGSLDKRSHSLFRILGIKVGIRFRVKLYAVSACFSGETDILGIGTNEYRRAYACVTEPFHHSGEKLHVRPDIPAGARGHGIGRVRHKSHLLGLYLQHKVHELLRGIPLDVELGLDKRTQTEHVVTLDVTFIGTRMHRDTVGSESLAVLRHFQ